MRVLLSGGGTGGHIYPALAVAIQLRDVYQADILYLGSDDGLETELIPAAGLRLATIKAGKLQRYLSWRTVKGIARVPVGMLQAVQLVHDFHADVAFTSGGYVAVPAGLAAKLNGVPLLMHQQDVPPNLSNRLLAPMATRISVAFADSMRYFPSSKTMLLGNPLRQEILDVCATSPQEARTRLGFAADVPLVLVTGGSQGARHLNQVVCQALPELLKDCQVLQISGSKLFSETRTLADRTIEELPTETKQRYRLVPYMSDEMPLALQAAEVVVCRAGAATLSELAILGKPSILVPLPPAIGSSPQEANAHTFAQHHAAEVIRNDDLRPDLLVTRLRALVGSPTSLHTMTEAVKSFARAQATQDIVSTLLKMAQEPVVHSENSEVVGL